MLLQRRLGRRERWRRLRGQVRPGGRAGLGPAVPYQRRPEAALALQGARLPLALGPAARLLELLSRSRVVSDQAAVSQALAVSVVALFAQALSA